MGVCNTDKGAINKLVNIRWFVLVKTCFGVEHSNSNIKLILVTITDYFLFLQTP